MLEKFSKTLGKMYRGEKGITGLETAIILIAFVTVAAVLAYTVLSAGIFSAERGQEAVYSGLESAQSTMVVKGSVLVTQTFDVEDNLDTRGLQFNLAMAVAGSSVDLDQVVVNYWNDNGDRVSDIDTNLSGSLSGNDTFQVEIADADLTGFSALTSYQKFTIEIIPPTGATLTIERALPGDLGKEVVSLY